MPAEGTWDVIARLIVGAFDVDIQHWMGNAFVKLRETPVGASFADWAEENQIAFEVLLRCTSALVRQLPNDDNLMMETVYTQLSRLPVEVERAVKNGVPTFVSTNEKDAESFFEKYQDAIQDLPDEDLARVAALERRRLQEWVNSPARIRPHLLAEWAKQDAGRDKKKESSRAALKEFDHTVATKVRAFNQHLKDQQTEREANEPNLSRLERIKRAIW